MKRLTKKRTNAARSHATPFFCSPQTTSVGFASTAIPRDERYVHDAMRTTDGDDRDDARTRRDGAERKVIHDETDGNESRGHARVFRASRVYHFDRECVSF